MIPWVIYAGLLALSIAAGVPAFLRASALIRCRPYLFETHGAANDGRY
jgi:hypothetical protein